MAVLASLASRTTARNGTQNMPLFSSHAAENSHFLGSLESEPQDVEQVMNRPSNDIDNHQLSRENVFSAVTHRAQHSSAQEREPQREEDALLPFLRTETKTRQSCSFMLLIPRDTKTQRCQQLVQKNRQRPSWSWRMEIPHREETRKSEATSSLKYKDAADQQQNDDNILFERNAPFIVTRRRATPYSSLDLSYTLQELEDIQRMWELEQCFVSLGDDESQEDYLLLEARALLKTLQRQRSQLLARNQNRSYWWYRRRMDRQAHQLARLQVECQIEPQPNGWSSSLSSSPLQREQQSLVVLMECHGQLEQQKDILQCLCPAGTKNP